MRAREPVCTHITLDGLSRAYLHHVWEIADFVCYRWASSRAPGRRIILTVTLHMKASMSSAYALVVVRASWIFRHTGHSHITVNHVHRQLSHSPRPGPCRHCFQTSTIHRSDLTLSKWQFWHSSTCCSQLPTSICLCQTSPSLHAPVTIPCDSTTSPYVRSAVDELPTVISKNQLSTRMLPSVLIHSSPTLRTKPQQAQLHPES